MCVDSALCTLMIVFYEYNQSVSSDDLPDVIRSIEECLTCTSNHLDCFKGLSRISKRYVK
jgi:hypothetical protein